MRGAAVREARRERGWTQAELAERLEVTQAYVCLLERQRRAVPAHVVRRLVRLFKLSPTALPVHDSDEQLDASEAPAALAAVGYPGFAHVRARPKVNPADLVLQVLRSPGVDSRVLEAMPWVLLRYPDLDWEWLVRAAKVDDLQNRLGFLVTVAKTVAELRGDFSVAETLSAQQALLERSRLVREDAFRAMTEAERRWLRQQRPAHAAHWNMLTTMDASQLANAW